MFLVLGYCKYSWHGYLDTNCCLDICFHFYWVNIGSRGMVGLYGKYVFKFIRNQPPNCFSTWQYHFMLTISVSESQLLHFLANSSYHLFNFSHSIGCIVIVVIWIFVFLLTTLLNVSASTFLAPVYFLWWSIYSNILPIFFCFGLLVFLLLNFEFSFCFRYKSLIRYAVCKHYFPSLWLVFYRLTVIWERKSLILI